MSRRMCNAQHEVRTIASKARGEFDDTKETWETFALMNIQLLGRPDSWAHPEEITSRHS